jgi:glycosyltransferase involved in cell wall biosynthesis
MQISVIIPSYNSCATIESCLQAVLSQDVEEGFEVIVVDSSTDDTPQIIQSRFPQVRLVHRAERLIPSAARNVGIEVAKGELLAFTDADCLPDKQWLQNIVEAHQSEYLIIGGSVSNGRPHSRLSRAEYFIEFREFSSSSPRREVRFLPTCNLSAKRELFDCVGLFPNVRASEDTLFAHRLQKHGIPILFVPEIRIAHLNRDRWQPYLKNQMTLGENAAMVRRIMSMPGSRFAKMPFLFPVLPLVRTLRTLQFIFQNPLRQALSQLLGFVAIYPHFFLGSVAWSLGFYRGARTDMTAVETRLRPVREELVEVG